LIRIEFEDEFEVKVKSEFEAADRSMEYTWSKLGPYRTIQIEAYSADL
jgi:hypothetical protein